MTNFLITSSSFLSFIHQMCYSGTYYAVCFYFHAVMEAHEPIQQMQSCKKMSPPERHLHHFGYGYSHHTQRQAFFNHRSPSPTAPIDQNIFRLQEENSSMRREIVEVRKILSAILYGNGEEGEGQDLMELLQELLGMVLAKAEENALLKQKLEEMRVQTVQKIQSNLSLQSSRKESSTPQSSQQHLYSPIDDGPLRPSESQNGMTSRYWPKVLFSIGKEVKTIGQISSNTLVKKDSQHSYSKTSSQENSFKDLMHLKKNRLSIDKSIYIQTDRDCDPRFSVQNSHRTLQGQNITKNNLVTNELTPIKEERFSDKLTQMNYSKVKAAGVSFANRERFTFESTNTDPSSYNSRPY